MTNSRLEALVQAAYGVAASASPAQTRYRGSAYVDWSALHELRRALLALNLGTDAGWKFPLEPSDVGTGWRRAHHNDTWSLEYDAQGNQRAVEKRCRSCKQLAHWIRADGALACDKHVPKREAS